MLRALTFVNNSNSLAIFLFVTVSLWCAGCENPAQTLDKTYDHQAGYTFEYPANWVIKSLPVQTQLIPPDEAQDSEGVSLEGYIIGKVLKGGFSDPTDPRVLQSYTSGYAAGFEQIGDTEVIYEDGVKIARDLFRAPSEGDGELLFLSRAMKSGVIINIFAISPQGGHFEKREPTLLAILRSATDGMSN